MKKFSGWGNGDELLNIQRKGYAGRKRVIFEQIEAEKWLEKSGRYQERSTQKRKTKIRSLRKDHIELGFLQNSGIMTSRINPIRRKYWTMIAKSPSRGLPNLFHTHAAAHLSFPAVHGKLYCTRCNSGLLPAYER